MERGAKHRESEMNFEKQKQRRRGDREINGRRKNKEEKRERELID
jgi:hypothetical protein